MAEAPSFSEIAPGDIDQLAALVADSFDDYRAFAPAGWQPPPASEQIHVLQGWIADPDFWGELASTDRALVGHATFTPAARHSFQPVADPALAHLGHLFVKPPYWGSGVATQLLARARTAAAGRGFAAMRLFVPVGQGRARRFYTREGFIAVGDPFDFGLGLPVLEYQCPLEPDGGHWPTAG
jgi:GNAT superfamily N-acetyltransferase